MLKQIYLVTCQTGVGLREHLTHEYPLEIHWHTSRAVTMDGYEHWIATVPEPFISEFVDRASVDAYVMEYRRGDTFTVSDEQQRPDWMIFDIAIRRAAIASGAWKEQQQTYYPAGALWIENADPRFDVFGHTKQLVRIPNYLEPQFKEKIALDPNTAGISYLGGFSREEAERLDMTKAAIILALLQNVPAHFSMKSRSANLRAQLSTNGAGIIILGDYVLTVRQEGTDHCSFDITPTPDFAEMMIPSPNTPFPEEDLTAVLGDLFIAFGDWR